MKLKGAIIGCGFFATNHILSWKNFKDVDLVGVCDLDEERAINASNLAKGFMPLFSDSSKVISTRAAAPSDIEEELAAVTVPSFLNTGGSSVKSLREVSLGCSSISKMSDDLPFFYFNRDYLISKVAVFYCF